MAGVKDRTRLPRPAAMTPSPSRSVPPYSASPPTSPTVHASSYADESTAHELATRCPSGARESASQTAAVQLRTTTTIHRPPTNPPQSHHRPRRRLHAHDQAHQVEQTLRQHDLPITSRIGVALKRIRSKGPDPLERPPIGRDGFARCAGTSVDALEGPVTRTRRRAAVLVAQSGSLLPVCGLRTRSSAEPVATQLAAPPPEQNRCKVGHPGAVAAYRLGRLHKSGRSRPFERAETPAEQGFRRGRGGT